MIFIWTDEEINQAKKLENEIQDNPIDILKDNITYEHVHDPDNITNIIKNHDGKIDYFNFLIHGGKTSIAEFNYYAYDSNYYNQTESLDITEIESYINQNGTLEDHFSDDAIIRIISCEIAKKHDEKDNTMAEMLSYLFMRPIFSIRNSNKLISICAK